MKITAPGYIATGESVNISLVGSSGAAASNISSVSGFQRDYVEREIGMFIHFSPSTFLGTQFDEGNESRNSFNPSAIDIDQWISTAISMKAKYVCLTTKHSGGFCLWPTATSAHNIVAGSWYGAHGNMDIVDQFCAKARAAGLAIGLYLAVSDRFYQNFRFTDGGTGTVGQFDGTYRGRNITQFVIAQLTELLSNYGPIDFIWTDGWGYVAELGYTLLNYPTVRAAMTALQPNCLLVENGHTGDLSHSDIAEHEMTSQPEPPSTNLIPAETIETGLVNDMWFWNPGLETYRDPQFIADKAVRMKAARSAYMINLAPNSTGVIPVNGVTFANSVGSLINNP